MKLRDFFSFSINLFLMFLLLIVPIYLTAGQTGPAKAPPGFTPQVVTTNCVQDQIRQDINTTGTPELQNQYTRPLPRSSCARPDGASDQSAFRTIQVPNCPIYGTTTDQLPGNCSENYSLLATTIIKGPLTIYDHQNSWRAILDKNRLTLYLTVKGQRYGRCSGPVGAYIVVV